MLASLDPLGLPLATEVLSGEHADDPVYLPIIARVRDGLQKHGLLYVGDCKMAALQTRATLQAQEDFYLYPLAAVQLPPEQLHQAIEAQRKLGASLVQVMRTDERGALTCLAQGYETRQTLSTLVDDHQETWEDRCLLVQNRLQQTQQALTALTVRRQGKPRLTEQRAVEVETSEILTHFRVEGLLRVQIQEHVHERSVRAYRGYLSGVRRESTFTSEREEAAIAQAASLLGWRAYATNHLTEHLSLEQAVEAYRDEYLVERNFARLKGRPLSLAPLYVQRDDHWVGLVRLLTIALRVITLLEGVARQHLGELHLELTGLFAGNPKRRTSQPTTERLLEAFRAVTLTIVRAQAFTQRHVTPLSSLQEQILILLGLSPVVYLRLEDDS